MSDENINKVAIIGVVSKIKSESEKGIGFDFQHTDDSSDKAWVTNYNFWASAKLDGVESIQPGSKLKLKGKLGMSQPKPRPDGTKGYSNLTFFIQEIDYLGKASTKGNKQEDKEW